MVDENCELVVYFSEELDGLKETLFYLFIFGQMGRRTAFSLIAGVANIPVSYAVQGFHQ